MSLRHDPGYVAARIVTYVRDMTLEAGPPQVATIGKVDFFPNLINVVPGQVTMTVDLRHTEEGALQSAEGRLSAFLRLMERHEGVTITTRRLARFEPVAFDERVVDLVERTAARLGNTVRRLPSGAGHDAQMLARVCPTAMVFTQSRDGLSHNPAEFTEPADLVMGADILLQVLLELSEGDLV